jgi:hypothetical protein
MARSTALKFLALALVLPIAVVAVIWLTAPSTAEMDRLIAELETGPQSAGKLFPGEWSSICLGTPYMSPTDTVGDQAHEIECEGWRRGDLGDEVTSLVVLIGDASNAARSCRAVILPNRSLMVTEPGCRPSATANLEIVTAANGALHLEFVPD